MIVLLVSIGGFLGAVCRYVLTRKIQHNKIFPFGTLVVNLLGAFLLGLVVGMQIKGFLYAFIGIGFMGAFTTFSTLKLESEQLRKKKMNVYFYTYLPLSYILGIGLAFVGIIIGKSYI